MTESLSHRDMLVEVGSEAMGSNGWRWWAPRHLTRLLDVWEPLIRGDERRKIEMNFAIDREVIEDELGEKIAKHIEAQQHRMECMFGCSCGIRRDAQIARGQL